MSVLIRIPTPLQKLAGDQAELNVEASTLREAVEQLASKPVKVFGNKNLGDNSTGLLQNQLWVTIMQAMGLGPLDYNMKSLGLLRSAYPDSTSTYGEFLPPGGTDS